MGSFTAVGTIVSLVVGAGMLALPFVAVQAGFWNSLFQIVFLGLVVTILNLFVGEVVLRTKGNHQLVSLAEKYLGGNAKKVMFVAFALGQYGALVAYIVGIRSVIINLFGVYGAIFSWIVTFSMFLLLLFRLRIVARVESFLTVLMLGLILLLSLVLVPETNFSNFSLLTSTPFAGFGVIMFSFMGFTIIPEVASELKKKMDLSRVIILSYGIIILLYLFFSYSFVGAFGSSVSKVAVESLSGWLLVAGSFLTILLFVTSFLAIGVVMKDLFAFDYKFKRRVPWLLTVIPVSLMLIFSPDFVGILSLVGSFTAGAVGIMVCLMVIKSREKGNRKPEFVVWGQELLPYIVIAILIAGVAWQVSVFL